MESYAKYSIEEAKEYMHIYAQMVHLVDTFPGGVIDKTCKSVVQEAINNAKTKIPDELKDTEFRYYLIGLENIVKGRPYNSVKRKSHNS